MNFRIYLFQLQQYNLIVKIVNVNYFSIIVVSSLLAPLLKVIYLLKQMFPSVKAKQDQKSRIKDKEWQDPMLKSTVPEYSPLKDKHTGSYRKLLMGNTAAALKVSDTEAAANKKIKQKTYFEKKLDLLARIREKHNNDYEDVRVYEDLMNKSGAPNFYSYFSLMPLLNLEDSKNFLLTQTKKVKQKSSSYHRLSTSIRAREECLQRLKKTLQKIKQTQILQKKQLLKDEINHLRVLTVNLIQQIKIWRNQLGNIEQRAIYFTDDQKNCLIDILNDNKFIFSSKLGELINFGEKNDPFLVAPLKKAQGKEQSQLLQIVKPQKQMVYYQKYMQYLASQKAYEMNLNLETPKKAKSNSVQKIYSTPKLDLKQLNPVQEKGNEDQDAEAIERQKQREQRLKKNQEKINSIKSIYENYAKKKGNLTERKLPETDIDEKRETFRVKKQKKNDPNADSDFQGLVKIKLDTEKKKLQEKSKQRQKQKSKKKKDLKSTSMTKLPKPEQKMIDNLRQIQESLKSKLQIVQKENKIEESGLATARYSRKNNDQLVKQLKMQIIQKIEKQNTQKQKLRKKKKEQQEKALEQIKLKMKKQMEQKLQQKKRQKMLEREQLQKRLKEQEERLNNQRQMQIQLQIKLNKQREMRELQKIRRQALEKQKKYKEQLEKQQKLRKEKEEAIEKQKREKEKLLQQLKKKELKEQIQQDLRREMNQRKKNQDQASIKEQMQAIKKQKQNQLVKQIELLKLKQKDQLSILEKQASIRQRMLKLKKQQEELKRKQVQALMKNLIQKEKEDIGREALEKRVELEENMRASIKEKMLEQYKTERQSQIEANRSKRQKALEEQIYRQKIRQKIQKQMRMQAINRTKKDLDERQAKKYQMRTKLQGIKFNIQNNNKIDKDKIQQQVKKDVIERVIFDKNAQRENAKMALRAQFQKQLLSSAIPQIYQPKDSFLLKHTEQLAEDDNLARRMELTAQKPTNQKPPYDQKSANKSQVRDVRNIITNEQLQIYSKQKSKVNQMREQPIDKLPTRLQEPEDQGFELMNKDRNNKNRGSDNEYDVKIVRKEKPKPEEQKFEKKKKKKGKDNDSEDSDYDRRRKSKAKKKKKRVQESETQSEVDSEEQDRKNKKKGKKKNKRRDSQQQQSAQDQKRSPIKKRIQFKSEQQKQKEQRATKKSKIKNQKQQDSSQQQPKNKQKVVVHFDADKKQTKQPNLSQIQPITIKKSNLKQVQATNKFQISIDAIPEAQLDQYLEGHYARLPDDQTTIQMHNREDLYRKLMGQLTFCLLLGHFDNKLIGMAYAYHDRTRSDVRKFVIVHVGTYKTEDLREFIINASNFIFRKDPCDEIEFHYKYDEANQSQLKFSTDFNQWFDKYGNVYQKKLQNSQYERKYVLKRQFNQKCQVVLGGINKNTFRNIFSVYAGVMMSDADMVVFKEELRDVIAPEDEMSYAIMIAELFRTYLTPDQAQALKGKVKQFAKLKQLLVLVVMLQKKKVKMDELKLYEYKSLIQLNMRLMSQGKDVIRYCKDPGVEHNRVFFCQLNHGFNLPFNFQTTSLPVETKQNQIRQISYFRLAALPPYKLHIIKSSIYNGQMNILPTENSKYKMFIMNATEYMQLKDSNKMDLFMYIRLFLKNVKSHNVAVWKYVWMPEMMDKGAWNVREFRSFLNKDIFAHDSVNISYRQFLPGALIIEPEHRDLVITPPFIVGIMSMTLEQVTEGSPLYARLIDIDALRTIEIE